MSDERNWGQTSGEPAGGENRQGNQVSSPTQKDHTGAGESQRQAGGGNGPVPPRYAHYQFDQNGGTSPRPNPGVPKRRKKSSGTGQKFGLAVALALVFGLVAGLMFQGVNLVFRAYLGDTQLSGSQVGVAETVNGDGAASEASAGGSSVQGVSVAGVAESAMPAVVAITSVSIQEIPSFFGSFGFGNYGIQEYPTTGSGSGIIVGENNDELLIATNNHVVEGATTLSVCFIGNDVVNAEAETQNLLGSDGDINVEDAVSAKIKGTDADNDLAVVAVQKDDIPSDTMSQIKIAKIGDSDSLVVGEQVVAIGNALGYGQSVTSGWISALDRTVQMEDGTASDLLQTDAAINPGNSGGALLNMNGELIGINSAKYASSAVEGMGYAIPISKAKPILEELMNRTTRDKVETEQAGYLGVTVADLTQEATQMYSMPAGAFVTSVERGYGAQAAGIQKGDIIVKLDGQKVSGRDDLLDKLSYYAAGEEVEVVIARTDNGDYKEHTVSVTLSARPSTES